MPNARDELASLTLRGRRFTVDELRLIQSIVVQLPTTQCFELSKRICRELGWCQPNGRLKGRAHRDVLIGLDKRGWVHLPPLRRPNVYRRTIPLTPETTPHLTRVVSVREIGLDSFSIATGRNDREQEHLWSEYEERYHSLGYGESLGAHLKYFVLWRGEPLRWLASERATWKLDARDSRIGWSPEQRQDCEAGSC